MPATSRSAGSSVCTGYVDFSQAGIEQRWEAGYTQTRAVLARKPWARHFDPLSGVILYEAKVLTALAAE